jgi:hypothetical protein
VHEALWVTDGSGALRAFDGRTNQVTATVDLGRSTPDIPPALVEGGGGIWAYRFDTGVLALVDPGPARIASQVTIPPARPLAGNHLLYAGGAMWVAQPGRLWRATPYGTATPYDLPAGFSPSAMAAARSALWLADGPRLLRVDLTAPASMTQTVLPDGVRQLFANPSGLFALGTNSSEIRVLDTRTGRVTSSIQLPGHELALSMIDAGAAAWATGSCGDVLLVPSGPGYPVRATKVSDTSQDLPSAAGLDSLWVGDEVHSEIVRVSLASGQILARIPFGAADPDDPAFWIVGGRDSVWVVDTNGADGVSRIDPATNRAVRLVPSGHGTAGLSAVVSAPARTPGG